ncbi:MAG: potassium channel family protein [Candidatus Hatepunaea meridiana]|nr:potassium channel family protein [Candidatus Hatepunaea meridiana]
MHLHETRPKLPKKAWSTLIYLIEEVRLRWYIIIFSMVVLIWGFLYYCFTAIGHGIGLNGIPLVNISLWNSLYFSVVTISSLGYGDMHPVGISKLFVCLEVLIGFVIMGILLAKLSSFRLSYHVTRLFSSETQKRLDGYSEEFESLVPQMIQSRKMIENTFRATPDMRPTQEPSDVDTYFSIKMASIHSFSLGLYNYITYEIEHTDFFAVAPPESLIRVARAIDQVFNLLNNAVIGMTAEARTVLLKPENRKRILESVDFHKAICDNVNNKCANENVKAEFSLVKQTCNNSPESFFATPTVAADQPDQMPITADQPISRGVK